MQLFLIKIYFDISIYSNVISLFNINLLLSTLIYVKNIKQNKKIRNVNKIIKFSNLALICEKDYLNMIKTHYIKLIRIINSFIFKTHSSD